MGFVAILIVALFLVSSPLRGKGEMGVWRTIRDLTPTLALPLIEGGDWGNEAAQLKIKNGSYWGRFMVIVHSTPSPALPLQGGGG